jgi:PAS domain S-box-containing protein
VTGDRPPPVLPNEADLRRRAEARAGERGVPLADSAVAGSPEDLEATLHELRVHQIELELQNEELRRAHLELDVARARYFDLYYMAPVGYCSIDGEGLIQEANLTAAKLLETSRGALKGKAIYRFILKEDRDSYYLHRKQLLEGEQTQRSWELRMIRESGAQFWARLEATVARDPDDANALRIVMLDVTDRKQAELALRASEAMLKGITDAIADPIYLKDREGRWVFANPAALVAAGRSSDEVIGRTDREIHATGGGAEALSQTDRRVLDSGATETSEETRSTSRGERLFLTSKAPFRDQDGRIAGVVGSARDITERKELEVRTARQDRLANMGLVAAGVAHEINNPLTYVVYDLESLTTELSKLTEAGARGAPAIVDAFHCADEALGGALRIKAITKRLGTFARVEQLDLSAVDVNHALECASDMARHEIQFRAKLVKQLGALPPIWASEGKLTQVFLNLLINAAHAIDVGAVDSNRITLRTWPEGDDVLVEVADTGSGIASDELDKIFEPFFTTKPLGGGSGLGLPICRSILAELGGTIRVESAPGKGARFLVRLPVGRATTQERAADVDPTERPSAVRGRLLVVDDEAVITRILARLLGNDHEVVVAHSGREARALLESDRAFDLVLCDLMMTDTTGMELHAWLAKTDPVLARRVVFMSGGAFVPKMAEYLSEVGNLRIEKPFDSAQLQRLVPELILATRARDGNRRP